VFIAIATDRVPQDAAMVAGMVALIVTGVLEPAEALAGFANTGVATIGVLYILVAGLRETGAMPWATQRLIGSPTTVQSALLRMVVPAGALSAFVNNTPVVAIFIPVLQGWASRFRLPASKLMMPLSYIAILAGTCTLIGTSTNLVVDGLLRSHQGSGLGMFDITPVGLIVATAGVAYILLFANSLLPDRAGAVEQLENARQYAFEMRVVPGGALVGRSIGEAGLRSMANAYLLEIERQGHLVTAVGADEVLQAGDLLVCVGVVDTLAELRRTPGLEIAEEQPFKLDLRHAQRRLVELVVAPSAPFVGSTIRDARFRSRYDAAILSVSRDGERLRQGRRHGAARRRHAAGRGRSRVRGGAPIRSRVPAGERPAGLDPARLAPRTACARDPGGRGWGRDLRVADAARGRISRRRPDAGDPLPDPGPRTRERPVVGTDSDRSCARVGSRARDERRSRLVRPGPDRRRSQPTAASAVRGVPGDGVLHRVHHEQRGRRPHVPAGAGDRHRLRGESHALRGGDHVRGIGELPHADRLPDQPDGSTVLGATASAITCASACH
jgi:Trk K+ transport system NAD-binding subunit